MHETKDGKIMLTYLTDASLITVIMRVRICELGGLESLLNSCAQLDTRLHPGMDPGVGSSLEYECSVTQFMPGDYFYVK